ncbi:MAG: FtsQ-type POTRA domain-containing protein [Candidatus Kapabacteria bacterium]|nr:FtsQ-type POTRA domain-containing protein [Candidatus Kapabacteria bacterium]
MNFNAKIFSIEENKNLRRTKISSYIFVVVSVFFIAAIVLLGYKWNGSRIIKAIDIKGNYYLSQDEVKYLISPLVLNKTQDQISLSKLQQKLNSYPYIKSSTLMFSNLETLSIEITENVPKLILEIDTNYYYVMDDLTINSFRKFEKSLNIPLVDNFLINSKKDTILLSKVISFVDEANQDNQLKNFINRVVLLNENDECEIYLNNLKFGIKSKIKDNLNKELKNLIVFLGTDYYQKSNDKISYVDLRWNEKLYIKEKY